MVTRLSVHPTEILIHLETSSKDSRPAGPGQSKLEKDVLLGELKQVKHSKGSHVSTWDSTFQTLRQCFLLLLL